jgi:dephospho-CoA kinase
MKKPIVVLVGQRRAGKGECHTPFREQGYGVKTMSDFVKDEVRKHNAEFAAEQEIPREILIATGLETRKREGENTFAKKSLAWAEEQSSEGVVIDGPRFESEIVVFKQAGAFLVGVERPDANRSESIRTGITIEPTSDTGMQLMTEEERRIDGLLGMCQLTLRNEGTIQELQAKAEIVADVRKRVPKEGMKYYPTHGIERG